jgi:aspartate 1-decarboxylase
MLLTMMKAKLHRATVTQADRGSRVIGVNGAAARLVQKGDNVIIVTYCQLPAEEARNYAPNVVLLGDGNEIKHAA